MNQVTSKYIFSGHETFHCKNLWLKKGYDFVNQDGVFSDKASIDLGVGRNMVNSIRFWLKAYGIIDISLESNTKIADYIFSDENGKDKYIEDEATLWLLHYLLIINNYSSIYSLIFNDFRKIKPEFDKKNFITFLSERGIDQNKNTVEKDFSVFLRMYHSKKEKNIENNFLGLLADLELIQEKGAKYTIENIKEKSIPKELILFIILENQDYGMSISFKSLFSEFNSVGNILVFTKKELEDKLVEISENYSDIIYTNEAGIKELQFKGEKPKSLDVLNSYYERN